ncbi:hypothetical protein NDU88_002442 [Pleurodeles waltl]|uniref:Ricin B lectin domain-containing protein n=1 Tax=Pleurodeles waltl TaxID=8319 RepID=A0AAV7LCH2_PLEWA|nr:hypothetical protein NDU88_002442 [Pleurodeles waltl]
MGKQVVAVEEGFIRLQQVQVDEGNLRGGSLCLEAQHRAALIFRGCDNDPGASQLWRFRQAEDGDGKEIEFGDTCEGLGTFRTEERVVSGANNPTSTEWPGESADSGHRRSSEMPKTSRSADLGYSGLALHDETLD